MLLTGLHGVHGGMEQNHHHEKHGCLESPISRTWSMLSEAETVLHAH